MFPNYRDKIKHLESSTLSGIRTLDGLSWDCLISSQTFIDVQGKLEGTIEIVQMVWANRLRSQ